MHDRVVRLVVVCSFVALGGCDRVFQLDRIDAPATCFGRYGENRAGLFEVCPTPEPTTDFVAPASIDTGADCTEIVVQQDLARTEACVIAARTISIASGTIAVGPRPLVLVATENLIVTSTLSASSLRAQPEGAGASFPGCNGPLDGGVAATTDGAGGGAGGSFSAVGGNGGTGAGNRRGGTPLRDPAPIAFVRGGCPGGAGGGASGMAGGTAAASGGALYLIAGKTLVIEGTLEASGAGGGGGAKGVLAAGGGGAGGGGGGSGGLIALDAPMIQLAATARIVANGGGGGGGGGSYGAVPGMPGGQSDTSGAFPFPAQGGARGGTGGTGGGGGYEMVLALPGLDATSGGAGGGGGGSTGFTLIYTTSLVDDGVMASPALGP